MEEKIPLEIDEEPVVEVVDLGEIDLLEEDLVPASFLCTGCDCWC